MKSLIFAAAAAAALATAAPALADDAFSPVSVYVNAGYIGVHMSDAGLAGDSIDLPALGGRVGVRAGKYLGAEAEGAFGVGHDTDTLSGAEVKLNSAIAAYAVGFIPVTSQMDFFARVGGGHASLNAKLGAASFSDGTDSFNYGAGVQFFFDEHNGVRGDYTRWDTEGEGGADVWSITYARKF